MSGNLVVRFAAPGDLLASGHPAAGTAKRPENLGLIRSRDHGDHLGIAGRARQRPTTTKRTRPSGDMILAVNAEVDDIQVSRDGGRSWGSPARRRRRRSTSSSTPGDAQHWAVSTEQGTFVSSDGGGSCRPRDTTFGARLIWPSANALYSIDRNGAVRVSAVTGAAAGASAARSAGLPSVVAGGRKGRVVRRGSSVGRCGRSPGRGRAHGRRSRLCADRAAGKWSCHAPNELPKTFCRLAPPKVC